MKLKSAKTKDLIKEFNKFNIRMPLVLQKSESKYVSYYTREGYLDYETIGVKAEIIRIYSAFNSGYNFAFGTYIENGVEVVKVSESTFEKERGTAKKIVNLGTYEPLEFHELFKELMKLLRNNPTNHEIDFYINYFKQIQKEKC